MLTISADDGSNSRVIIREDFGHHEFRKGFQKIKNAVVMRRRNEKEDDIVNTGRRKVSIFRALSH